MQTKTNFFTIILRSVFLLLTIIFTTCSDKDKINSNEPSQSQDTIVGRWECRLDAYGDPWDEPLIMMFDSDGAGYQWFSDEPFSDRWEFYYTATSSKIKIKTSYGYYDLRHEISSNSKTLIIYGWDDNDMAELWFTRIK